MEGDFELSQEYLQKQEHILIERMSLARKWVIIGLVYYFIRATIIIYPMWKQNTIGE